MLAAALIVLAAFVGDEAPAAAMKHHEGPMEKVLAEAKTSGKTVLVDVYAEWCGPCKFMAANVFTDAAVAAFSNENYIFYSVDGEKGEGPALMKKFSIEAYPTFLFLGPDGAEVERSVGGSSKEEFLGLLKDVKAGNTLAALKAKVEKSPEDAEARGVLGKKLFRRQDPAAREHLEKAITLDAKDAKPTTIDARFCLSLIEAQEQQSPDPIAAFAKKYPASPSAVEAHKILVRIYGQMHDDDAALESLVFLDKKSALDAGGKNEYSWMLATNGKELEKALALVDAALKEMPNEAAFLDTRAECLSRLGRHDEAVAAQKKAISKLPEGMPDEKKAEYKDRLAEFEKKRDEAKAKAGEKPAEKPADAPK